MTLEHLYQFDDETDRILVTCALPYVNNVPHLGNMVPLISADVYARYLRLKKIKSIYICATDEHGTRTEIEAAAAGIDEDTYCQRLHDQMLEIFRWFNIEFTHFGRTSCKHNHLTTRDLFQRADSSGFIVKEELRQLYCSSCDRYLPDTFVEGTCPYCNKPGANGDQCDGCTRFLDPLELVTPRCKTCGEPPTARSTEHLALRLDALAPGLKQWIEGQGHWEGIIRNMPLGWIAEGLRPRAITRDLSWGVQVPKPGFEDKVFYVWFDAPIGYIAATAEWADKTGETLEDWWKKGRARLIHFLGKDNVPFHTLMWPGTLMAANDAWNLPDYIASNDYLNYEGGAFSKTRKQGVFSDDVLEMGFPADAWRFYLMVNRPEKRDADFEFEAFKKVINGDLTANIGNLVNRALSFAAKRFQCVPEAGDLNELDRETLAKVEQKAEEIDRAYREIELRQAARHILELGDIANRYFQASQPWRTFKEDRPTSETTLSVAIRIIHRLAHLCWPIMPDRCEAILQSMGAQLGEEFRTKVPLERPELLFSLVEDERAAELTERYRGSGGERFPPLEFVKSPEIDWPCVILELTGLTVRRRVSAVEKLKEEMLREIDVDTIESRPHVGHYDQLLEEHDKGGRRTSVRNLIDIIRREGKLPNINTVVDIYNAFSLKEGIVMGAYERRTIHGKLIYAQADGSEHFIPVKGKEPEPIAPGEWVLRDETKMVVTKVTTKQSEAAAVTSSTSACAMCIQGNPLTSVEELLRISEEMAKRIVEFSGGSFRVVYSG